MVNENMEFEAIVRQWLDNVRLRVKESSYVKYNNLVRNHIIYYYRLLHERQAGQVQISLFDAPASVQERPIPPEVPDNYMVAGCEHSHRLDKSGWGDKLVWGMKGEYSV